MKKHIFNRRMFLKNAGGFLVGALLWPLQRLFACLPTDDRQAWAPQGETNRDTSLKEARHYTSTDALAG